MKTMTLTKTPPRTEALMNLSDAELEHWFADAELTVTAVPHCDSAACAICFQTPLLPAKAA